MSKRVPVQVRLHLLEINSSIASFFDNCWTARLGDEMNGFVAEKTLGSYAAAEAWLDQAARRKYKAYAERYPEHEPA